MVQFAEKRRAAMDAVMRDEVYRGAVEILTEQGPPALTMDRLARTVGVSRATLYNYFSDRDAVLTFVDEQTLEPFLEQAETIFTGPGTAEEKLAAHVLTVFQMVEASKPLLYALYIKESVAGERREAKNRRHNRMIASLVRVFEQGIKDQEFRKLPLPDTAILFSSALRGHVEYMADNDITRPPEELASMLMDVLMPAFRAT